jgi:hypothetical protein
MKEPDMFRPAARSAIVSAGPRPQVGQHVLSFDGDYVVVLNRHSSGESDRCRKSRMQLVTEIVGGAPTFRGGRHLSVREGVVVCTETGVPAFPAH